MKKSQNVIKTGKIVTNSSDFDIFTDSNGYIHVTAEFREDLADMHLYTGKEKRDVNWNFDLRSYDLIFRTREEKENLRAYLSQRIRKAV